MNEQDLYWPATIAEAILMDAEEEALIARGHMMKCFHHPEKGDPHSEVVCGSWFAGFCRDVGMPGEWPIEVDAALDVWRTRFFEGPKP